jgi:hypothetical protein
MDKNELIRRYELASGNDYKAIKALAYEYIKECSTSDVMSKHTNGMLMLIKHIDSWVAEFNAELANRS